MPENTFPPLARRHLRFGWWSLFVFLSLGVVLEALHGLKIGWYLDVSSETRRLMFTLGHAHGTLFAIVNILYGLTVREISSLNPRPYVSACLIWGAMLVPGGFLLGGVIVHGGDPSLGILFVPAGALILMAATFSIARAVDAASRPTKKE